jgi:hypothetical protein
MLSVLSLAYRLETENLEGVSITAFIRWIIFVSVGLFLGALVGAAVASSDPIPENSSAIMSAMKIGIACSFLLVARDIIVIRRQAKHWNKKRLYDLSIASRLPLLLLLIVPFYFIVATKKEFQDTVSWSWANQMLWIFAVISVFFYLTCFVLLFSIPKLPKKQAFIGFILAACTAGWGFFSELSRGN